MTSICFPLFSHSVRAKIGLSPLSIHEISPKRKYIMMSIIINIIVSPFIALPFCEPKRMRKGISIAIRNSLMQNKSMMILVRDTILSVIPKTIVFEMNIINITVFSDKEEPFVSTEDGKAYSFVYREDVYDGKPIHELLAYDITEEYQLTEELREKQKTALKINRRLKALNSTIQYLIMDKETLRIKMHIHDSFGEMLLMTKHYLVDPENTDKKEMLSLWRRNIALLKNEERENWQTPCFFSLRHADSLGIRIEMNGELPEDETLITVVDSAITVHVTNVLRHAEGDIAYISIEKTADGYLMRFTNNGRPPCTPVNETGGLANLRRMTETIGGKMTINSSPQFEMILQLPERSQEEF